VSLPLAVLLFIVLAAAGFYALTLRAAHQFLLSGGFRRPLTIRPEDFGLSYEKVQFKTADGLTLAGWFIPAKAPTDRTLVLCHGWGTNKGEILPATLFLVDRFNLLYFDFRFCGESEGKRSSLGYLELRDFDAALEFLKANKPDLAARLGAYGLSMGAATAFMGITRHPEIRAAVIENPFPSFRKAVRTYSWHKWKIPYYPFLAPVVWQANRVLGVDGEAWSPIRFAPRVRTPVFFIHAENDPITPPAETRALYEHVQADKELWIVPGAAHEDIHEVARDEYQRRIRTFYERYL
jgi:dipeptidyl aminopeptidase/acylaminoacyl peptidase